MRVDLFNRIALGPNGVAMTRPREELVSGVPCQIRAYPSLSPA